MDEYKVRLPEFLGPLDLLLHLVKRNEVDIRDIPVAVIAEQFSQYLDVLKVIDADAVGEFLVTASMLLEIKSRLVLMKPTDPAEAETAEDPRRDLVQQLLEYKRYRDAAMQLESQAVGRQRQFQRSAASETPAGPARLVQSPELWDLVSAFGRIIQEALALQPEQIVSDDTPQQAYVDQVLASIQSHDRVPFRAIFTPPYHRLRLIGLFLAVLELIKNQQIMMEADEATGEIILIAASSDRGAEHLPE